MNIISNNFFFLLLAYCLFVQAYQHRKNHYNYLDRYKKLNGYIEKQQTRLGDQFTQGSQQEQDAGIQAKLRKLTQQYLISDKINATKEKAENIIAQQSHIKFLKIGSKNEQSILRQQLLDGIFTLTPSYIWLEGKGSNTRDNVGLYLKLLRLQSLEGQYWQKYSDFIQELHYNTENKQMEVFTQEQVLKNLQNQIQDPEKCGILVESFSEWWGIMPEKKNIVIICMDYQIWKKYFPQQYLKVIKESDYSEFSFPSSEGFYKFYYKSQNEAQYRLCTVKFLEQEVAFYTDENEVSSNKQGFRYSNIKSCKAEYGNQPIVAHQQPLQLDNNCCLSTIIQWRKDLSERIQICSTQKQEMNCIPEIKQFENRIVQTCQNVNFAQILDQKLNYFEQYVMKNNQNDSTYNNLNSQINNQQIHQIIQNTTQTNQNISNNYPINKNLTSNDTKQVINHMGQQDLNNNSSNSSNLNISLNNKDSYQFETAVMKKQFLDLWNQQGTVGTSINLLIDKIDEGIQSGECERYFRQKYSKNIY